MSVAFWACPLPATFHKHPYKFIQAHSSHRHVGRQGSGFPLQSFADSQKNIKSQSPATNPTKPAAFKPTIGKRISAAIPHAAPAQPARPRTPPAHTTPRPHTPPPATAHPQKKQAGSPPSPQPQHISPRPARPHAPPTQPPA
ncbi:MAG: hypothetical protein LBQ31_06470 [Bacteroidales bacterium]|jgi:hypothetical protein|nr:hypothetical protein [Bacteroidales bacterium]